MKLQLLYRKLAKFALGGMTQSMAGAMASRLRLLQNQLYYGFSEPLAYTFERNFLELTQLHALLYVDNSVVCFTAGRCSLS